MRVSLQQALPSGLHEPARIVRRRAFELAGSDRHSQPSLHGVEGKLDVLFDRPGFFVEAGAFDGFSQSNTYWLERFRGWHGVLIEPVPDQAAKCRRRRRGTTVQAALVRPGSEGPVMIRYAGLMSLAVGSRGSIEADERHVTTGLAVQGGLDTYTVEVPGRTLTEVLAESGAPARIDLLSLDVEGFEHAVLEGLDVSRFAPRYVLVEINDEGEVGELLGRMGYDLVDATFTPRDALYVSQRIQQ